MQKISMDQSNGCWNWMAYKNSLGYGIFKVGVKTMLAHRVSYMLFIGDPYQYDLIMHSCDNPSCVNPMHLSGGSSSDNAIDRERKGRGRPLLSPTTILNKDQVIEIRKSNLKPSELSKIYKVKPGTIRSIKNGRIWKCV